MNKVTNISHIGPHNAKKRNICTDNKDNEMIVLAEATQRQHPVKPTKTNTKVSITGTRFAGPLTERTRHCMLDISAVVFVCVFLHNLCKMLEKK